MTGDTLKPGIRAGNTNALRHGLRSGKMPHGTRYIEHACNRLRVQLENAVLSAKQQVSIPDAACIQTVYTWERHAMLSHHWLRKRYDDLSDDQRLLFSREVAKARTERDRAMARLGIEGNAVDPWAGIDGAGLKVLETDAPDTETGTADDATPTGETSIADEGDDR